MGVNPWKHRWIPFMNRSGFYRSYLWKRSFKEWLLGRVIEHPEERRQTELRHISWEQISREIKDGRV